RATVAAGTRCGRTGRAAMTRYVALKLLSLLAVQFGITLVVVFMIRLVPGDVVDFLYGQYMSQQRVDEIPPLFGLDRPILVQYAEWLGNLLRGDFGRSLVSGRSIATDLALRFPVTLELTLLAVAWSVPAGVTLGVIAARRPYGKVDGLTTTVSLLGLA